MMKNLKPPLEVEELIDLEKRFTIIGATIEIYVEDKSKYARIFEFGDEKENFCVTKFGYIDGSDEFENFVIEEGTIVWEKIFGKDYAPGVYEVDLLLRVVNDGDGMRHWYYFEYENSDNVFYHGTTEKYTQELIGWQRLSDSETLMDIFL